jgi:hypothetical protein
MRLCCINDKLGLAPQDVTDLSPMQLTDDPWSWHLGAELPGCSASRGLLSAARPGKLVRCCSWTA